VQLQTVQGQADCIVNTDTGLVSAGKKKFQGDRVVGDDDIRGDWWLEPARKSG
jgi:hypothetical protein